MNLRELLTGAPPQTLGLDAKGFAYPQHGGNSSGFYYGSGMLNGLTAPTSRDYAAVRIELSSALAVCLNTVTNAFPEAELCVEREVTDGEDEREPKHPALMLMERPSAYFSGADVTTAVVRDLMTSSTGSGYLVKRRGAYGKPVELWPVPSSMMRPVWPESGDEFIAGYEMTIDGERRKLDTRDVIHFRNDIDGRCGVPMLPSVMQDLYIDTAAGDFTAAIMRNMGMPGAIVSPKQLPDGRDISLPAEKRDEFAAEWQRRFTGQGRGRVFIPSLPVDVHQLGFDPDKMSLRQIRQIAEERLSAIYNIPAIVAGFGAGLEHSTYANYEQALRAFWNGCIIPIQRRIATTLTNQFLRVDYANSEALYFEYEHDHIKALSESETDKRQRDRDDFTAGILTHHQVVSRLGITPVGADWMVMPVGVTAYPVDAMPVAPEPEPEPVPKPDQEPAKAERKSDIDRGAPLAWTDEQIEAESIITDEDIEDAAAWVREKVPALAELLDAETIKRKADTYETKAYRWNPRTRRYIGANGRMVPKSAVDAAMDAAVEVGRAEMAGYADALIADGDLASYQIAMKESIKRMHLAAVSTTRGGWSNLTASERGKAARAIQEQYRYLNKSCLAFSNGDRAIDGRVRATSQMYADAARVYYGEADYQANTDAIEAQPATHSERWIRAVGDSCPGCIREAARGWVELGTLPDLGSNQCLSNCRCSKSIRRKPRGKAIE